MRLGFSPLAGSEISRLENGETWLPPWPPEAAVTPQRTWKGPGDRDGYPGVWHTEAGGPTAPWLKRKTASLAVTPGRQQSERGKQHRGWGTDSAWGPPAAMGRPLLPPGSARTWGQSSHQPSCRETTGAGYLRKVKGLFGPWFWRLNIHAQAAPYQGRWGQGRSSRPGPQNPFPEHPQADLDPPTRPHLLKGHGFPTLPH